MMCRLVAIKRSMTRKNMLVNALFIKTILYASPFSQKRKTRTLITLLVKQKDDKAYAG